MSSFMVGFFFGLGFAAWVYSIIMKNTGGNTKNALIVAGAAGLFGLVVIKMIFDSLL